MEKEHKETRHEDKNAPDEEMNPLLMVKPSVTGTPLGMLSIMPIPSLDASEYKKDLHEADDHHKLP